jgi:hypothetical protein
MADQDVLQPTNDNDQGLDFGKKKKKKKTKDDLLKDEETAAASGSAADDKENNTEEANTGATEGQGGEENLDFGKKKSRAKKVVLIDEAQNDVFEVNIFCANIIV